MSVPTQSACRSAVVLLSVLVVSTCSFAEDVLLVRPAQSVSPEQRELEIAADFYGLHLAVAEASAGNIHRVLQRAADHETLAVAIDADALAILNHKALVESLRRGARNHIPLLILGLTPDTDARLLSAWSGGAAIGVRRLVAQPRLHYTVGRYVDKAKQLAGLEIPSDGDDAFYFALAGNSKVQELMVADNDRQALPVFIDTSLGRQEVFLLVKAFGRDDPARWHADDVVTAFTAVAPVMMFIKYSAGGRAWHALHHYANLTIDDPWLREPYGYLSYTGIFAEMEKHNFHTTIAFIPWNYDRSEADVASLVRDHPERFSVCIHGNNHDHKEFAESLYNQVGDVKQALARMEQFGASTHIRYDKVMIFPHSMGSEGVLGELKKYNYLATVNSSNVPIDRDRPLDPLFPLRPETVAFGDFPSVNRYPAAMQNRRAFIAINAFLDNPLLFYAHHDFFANGISAFNNMADSVNKLEPDTLWRGLGEIAAHLYLVRQRPDADYDVTTFTNVFQLDNSFGHDMSFYVSKRELSSATIASVTVDGQRFPFQRQEETLHLRIPVLAGQSRTVQIRYNNDLDLASVSTSKASIRIYFLRLASDFRDIALSKLPLGMELNSFYYKHELTPGFVIVVAGIVMGFCGGAVTLLVVHIKRKQPRRRHSRSSRTLAGC